MRAEAHMNAHAQLCRICDETKPSAGFHRGDSYCKPCRAELSRQYVVGGGVAEARATAAIPRLMAVSNSEANREAAIGQYAAQVDAIFRALLLQGGYGAVHTSIDRATRRLIAKHRAEIMAQGWVC